jgi:hypothetical protein
MPSISEVPVGRLARAQAAELSVLVDLEAGWENLRKPTPRNADGAAGLKDLSARQRAYDAFRTKLLAYNKRYTPAHVPELLLNTPTRLGSWCRAMRDLYLQVEHDPQGHRPVHLLEKARRWADQISARLNKGLVSRGNPPATIGDAVRELEALAQWCDDLTPRP